LLYFCSFSFLLFYFILFFSWSYSFSHAIYIYVLIKGGGFNLHINNRPADAELENEHAGHQTTLGAGYGLGSAGDILWPAGIGTENTGCVGAAGETETVGHVEEDVDVGVDTAEVLGAWSHGEDGNVG